MRRIRNLIHASPIFNDFLIRKTLEQYTDLNKRLAENADEVTEIVYEKWVQARNLESKQFIDLFFEELGINPDEIVENTSEYFELMKSLQIDLEHEFGRELELTKEAPKEP